MSSNEPESLICPECQATFRTRKTIGIGDAATMKCPRCGHLSTVGKFRNLNRRPESGGTPRPTPPPMQNSGSNPLPPNFDGIDVGEHSSQFVRSRRSRRSLLGMLDFFDFGFKRYVTPVILKFTWGLAVLLFFCLVSVAVLESTGAITADVLGEFNAGVQDAGFTWATVDDYQAPATGAEEGGGRSIFESETAKSIKRTISRAVGYAVALGAKILVSVLFLLWARVLVEGTIVVFQVASDVRAIRCATDN